MKEGDTIKRYEKEMLQSRLDSEEDMIADLKRVYEQASRDCAARIAALSARTDMENLQTIIYQRQYQIALKKQIDAILDMLQTEEFTSISDYLSKSYEDGFISSLYSLQKQDIPLCFPIDQSAVVKAIQTDSKISTNLYTRLGEDIKGLKTSIRAEISRGIANGFGYNEIAAQIAKGMNTPFKKAYNNAIRISRTEGTRVANQAAIDASRKAKAKGCDIVKQWSAHLDARTRDSHWAIHRQIRELDEPFSNGLMFPGDPSGRPEEVINCRCGLNQRARWALGRDETQMLGDVSQMDEKTKKRIAEMLNIPLDELEEYSKSIVPVNAKNYEDFKEKYSKIWNYKGSDLEKEAEARIAGYKAKRKNKQTPKG